MNILKIFDEIIGSKSKRSSMSASTEGRTNIGELRGFARLTRWVFRQPVKLEKPGKRLKSVTTDDVDPETGRVYPDYLKRRKRQSEEDLAAAGIASWGVKPNDD